VDENCLARRQLNGPGGGCGPPPVTLRLSNAFFAMGAQTLACAAGTRCYAPLFGSLFRFLAQRDRGGIGRARLSRSQDVEIWHLACQHGDLPPDFNTSIDQRGPAKSFAKGLFCMLRGDQPGYVAEYFNWIARDSAIAWRRSSSSMDGTGSQPGCAPAAKIRARRTEGAPELAPTPRRLDLLSGNSAFFIGPRFGTMKKGAAPYRSEPGRGSCFRRPVC